MFRKCALALMGLVLMASPGLASLVGVTSQAALGPNTFISWGLLGGDQTLVSNSFSVPTTLVTGKFGVSGGTGLVEVNDGVSYGWTFPINDVLLATTNGNSSTDSGPITLTFTSAFGVGALIQAAAPGQFTAQVKVFNGASLLDTFSEISNTAGDPIYIGDLNTVANITSVTFSLTSASDSTTLPSFAIDTLGIVSTSPEPSSVALAAAGLAALAFSNRRKKSGEIS